MNNLKNIIVAAAIAIAGLAGTPTLANANPHIKTTGLTSQPIGHAMFCQQLPQECAVRTSKTEAPALTRARWKDLVEVNSYANQNIEPITDQDLYGVEEHWTYPKNYGDCEDYVLLKRYMLLQRGWPASSLLITVVKQPNGEGHAVLTVRTNRGDYTLDNLEAQVKQWDDTPYQYLKRQSVNHTGRWSAITDARTRVAGY